VLNKTTHNHIGAIRITGAGGFFNQLEQIKVITL
jgi:hypothetical protein